MESILGSKGGQLVYSFIVDNTKYMGNNNGDHGWCCNWSVVQWVNNLGMMSIIDGLLACYKKEMCVVALQKTKCVHFQLGLQSAL
jgi:hypothetical protein